MRQAKDAVERSTSEYKYETLTRDETMLYMDANMEDYRCGWCVNDLLDDFLVNVKVITKGDMLVILATTDIHEEDKVFISSKHTTGFDKTERLPRHLTTIVRQEAARQGQGCRESAEHVLWVMWSCML